MKTRIELLEAVAKAAQKLLDKNLGREVIGWAEVDTALRALNAHTEAQQQTATLALWVDPEDGEAHMVVPGGMAESDFRRMGWSCLGTHTVTLDRESK